VTRIDEDTDGMFASVELHNIGGGAALRIQATVEYAHPIVRSSITMFPWLAANGQVPLAVRFELVEGRMPRSPIREDDFRVRGRYLDRLARPVDREIIDWKRDELLPTAP
jgi:hypothetical protein